MGDVVVAGFVVFTVGFTICLYWMMVFVVEEGADDAVLASIDILPGVIGSSRLSACSFC